MNETYLFDKTGSDSEIEQLEKLLTVYRIEPVFPAFSRAAAVERKPALSLQVVFGSALTLAALILWLGIGAAVYLNRTPIVAVEVKNDPVVEQPVRSIAEPSNSVVETKSPLSRVERRRRSITPKPAKSASVRKVTKAKTPTSEFAKLTPEERHAYNEVLVALWLTGSKLKVVQDTINRVDDKSNEK